MAIILNALGEGIGSGMALLGASMIARDAKESENAGRWQIEREKLAQEWEMKKAEIAGRKEEAEARGKHGRTASDLVAELAGKYGWESFGIEPLPDKASFTTESMTGQRIDTEGEMSDAVSRKNTPLTNVETKKEFDAEGYGKAKEGIVERNVDRATRIANPDKYDDQQKGVAQKMLNDLLAKANAETDPALKEELIKDVNKAAMAAGGKERYKLSDGVIVDTATGDGKTTEVGKSKITKNEADAAESRGDAAKALAKAAGGGDTTSMSRTELIQHNNNLRARLKSIDGELKSERAALKDTPKPERAAKQARIDMLVKEVDAVRGEIADTDSKINPKTKTPPTAAKPAAESKPPDITKIDGVPPGSRIGNLVAGKGWEVIGKDGKVIGHARN